MTDAPSTLPILGEMFDLAIAGERAAEMLYRGLTAKFAHLPEMVAFWQMYAAEERDHARTLEELREQIDPAVLLGRADPQMYVRARAFANMPVARLLAGVHNLEDAYQLVLEAENSESNLVFDFLISHFHKDQAVQAFLRQQLTEHIRHVTFDFPAPYAHKLRRLATEALPQAG